MSNYDWSVVKKIHDEARTAFSQSESAPALGKKLQDNTPLLLRSVAHISMSPIIMMLNNVVGDSYMFGAYILGMGSYLHSSNPIEIDGATEYMIDNIGNGTTTFNSEFIDHMVESVYKSVLPYIAGVAEEYFILNNLVGNNPHVPRVIRTVLSGMMIGYAIQQAESQGPVEQTTYFSDYEKYVVGLYNDIVNNGDKTAL